MERKACRAEPKRESPQTDAGTDQASKKDDSDTKDSKEDLSLIHI